MFCFLNLHQECIEAEDNKKHEGKAANRKKTVNSKKHNRVDSEYGDWLQGLALWVWIWLWFWLWFRPYVYGRQFFRFLRMGLIGLVDCIEANFIVSQVMH